MNTIAELSTSPRALVWVSDEADRCEEFNPSWLNWHGRTLAQECERGWRASVHPDDADWVGRTHLQHVGARTPYAFECHLDRGDGQERLVLVGAAPWYHHDGVFAGFVGSCLDIHDLPVERRSAGHIETFYRATVNALDEGIMVLEPGQAAVGTTRAIIWTPLVGTARGAALLRVARFVDSHGPAHHAQSPHLRGSDALLHGLRVRLARAPRSGTGVALVRLRLRPVDAPTDRLGHSAADDLLSVLAGRVAETVRNGDVVSQLDDRTLAVMLDGVESLECAQVVAETIRAAACHPVRIAGETFDPEMDVAVALVDSEEAAAALMAEQPLNAW